MLARRLIPCLDVAGGRVVKGVHFRELRDAGDPAEQAARYDAEGADEIVFLDIAASHEERGTLIDLVSRVADRLFVPFSVGGGIRSVADARQVLRSGADKVAVNTAAVRDPALVTRLADEFRSDAEGADEIVFLDIAASHEERGTLIDLVSRVADRLFVPFSVGGGIRSVADARQVLRSGADKVAVNTAAVRDPALVTRLADEF